MNDKTRAIRFGLACGMVAGCLLVCAQAAPLSAALITEITASADGDVLRTAGPTYTVSDDSTMVTSVNSGGNNLGDGIYEFSLASLPGGAVITGATLKLTVQSVSALGSAVVTFHAFAGDGVITTADHRDFTSGTQVASRSFASGTSAGTLLLIDFDDAVPVQAIFDDGAAYLAVRTQVDFATTFNIRSLEHTASTLKPTLELTYVPEPASVALLGLGGILVVLRRSRKGWTQFF